MFDGGWERGAGTAPSRPWSVETPGPELVAALAAAVAVDPGDDDGYDAVERLGAWEAIAAWAAAEQVDVAASLLSSRQGRAARTGVAQHDEFAATAMELATMARVAPATGEHRLHQATCLLERLPETFGRLRAGRIAYSHARVVIEQTQDCTDAAALAVDAAFWTGPDLARTPTQTRERIRRIILRLDPAALRRRVQRAETGRTVRYWSDDDGAVGVISMRLPADQARGVFAVIDAAAQQALDPPDTPREQRRSLGNRRADAAVDLILGAATSNRSATCGTGVPTSRQDPAHDEPAHDEPAHQPAETFPCDTTDPTTDDTTDDVVVEPAESGAEQPETEPAPTVPAGACDGSCGVRSRSVARPVRAQVRVLIPWQTLAGHSDAPAELEGHGPLPADLARRIAAGNGADTVLQRLLLDPVTGIARHLDLRRYRPPPSLRALVEDRDQYCHAPGCRRSARACDLDHVIAYDHTAPDGGGGAGRSHPDNIRPECRRHHNLKTRGRWHCEPHHQPGGPPAVRWTSPSGHTWIVRSPSLTDPDLTVIDDEHDEHDDDPSDDDPSDAPTSYEHPDFDERPGVADRGTAVWQTTGRGRASPAGAATETRAPRTPRAARWSTP